MYSKNWIFACSENLQSPFSVRFHGINSGGVTTDELLYFYNDTTDSTPTENKRRTVAMIFFSG